MKEIKLTQNKVAVVDDEDFEQLNQYKWYAHKQSNNCYASRTIRLNKRKITIKMHREVLNAGNGISVDHINGNGLDNRKENIRLCTTQQNAFNRKHPHPKNKLKTKGVRWHNGARKFIAKIKINGKKIHLGYFNVLGDADSAYRFAEEKYFGEFARKC